MMKQTVWTLWTISLAAPAALMLAGCARSEPAAGGAGDAPMGASVAAASDGKVAVANDFCPVMDEHPVKGGRATPELTRRYKGHTLGFCCDDCPEQWDAMDAAEKDAQLAKVLRRR